MELQLLHSPLGRDTSLSLALPSLERRGEGEVSRTVSATGGKRRRRRREEEEEKERRQRERVVQQNITFIDPAQNHVLGSSCDCL